MTTPHSVRHAANFVKEQDENEDDKKTAAAAPFVQPFQKMRRRLTVTGASQTIDGDSQQDYGVSKLKVSGGDADKQHDNKVRCAVTNYSGLTKKGHAPYNPRKKNQDAMIMAEDSATNTLILCVLDGHGEHGDGVATFFRDRLAGEMMKHSQWKRDVKIAATDAIHKLEQSIISSFGIDTEFSGTTLSMAIIRGNTITGVNIGDSRVIIGKDEVAQNCLGGCSSTQIVAEEFTHDHKPDLPKEKERILAAGGRVFAVEYDDGIDGPPRVWLGHMDVPGLAMSRSLGDAVAHTAGVTSEPEFTERELNPETDKFLVVATDGLWEFVTNQETAQSVVNSQNPSQSVEELVKEANARWMQEEQVIDDTTVITAYLFGYKSH